MIRRLLVLLLLLPIARPLQADPDGSDEATPSIAASALERLEGALRRGIRTGSYDPLYRACVTKSGDPAQAFSWLEAIHKTDSSAPADRKRAALWVAAHLHRRHGDLNLRKSSQ